MAQLCALLKDHPILLLSGHLNSQRLENEYAVIRDQEEKTKLVRLVWRVGFDPLGYLFDGRMCRER